MEKYKGKTFADLRASEIEYRGENYKIWAIEARPGKTFIFADVRLLTAITENGDTGCPTDQAVAYYVDPDEDVNATIK